MNNTQKVCLAVLVICSMLLSNLVLYKLGGSIAYVGDQSEKWMVPTQEATYVIGQYNSTHYYSSNHTGYGFEAYEGYEYMSTNASQGITFAIGNLTSGETIFLKAGTYNVQRIVIDKSMILEGEKGVILTADDTGVSTISYTSYIDGVPTAFSIAPILLVDSTSDVIIKNLVIDGNPLTRNFPRHGILIWDSERVKIENVEVKDVEGSGIETRSSGNYLKLTPEDSTLNTKHVQILNCYVHGTISVNPATGLKGFGINVAFSEDVVVERCEVRDSNESAFRTHYAKNIRFLTGKVYNLSGGEPFDIYRSDDVTINGNFVYEDGAGCYIYEYTRNIQVKNNYFYNATYPIRVEGVSGYRDVPIEYITFENNYVDGAFHLINDYLKHIKVSGNIITGELRIAKIDTTVTAGEDIFLEKNWFMYNGVNLVMGFPVTFKKNYFYNRISLTNSSTAILEGNEFTCDGSTYAVGVYITSGNSYVKIACNNFHDLTYQAIYAATTIATDTVEITDNYFNNIYMAGSPSPAIQFSNNNITTAIIKGNTFNNTQGTYSISIGNTAGEIQYNTVDKPISGSAATIKYNVGFVTENWVSATNTTVTTFVFNHGLAGTPDFVWCSFNTTEISAWTWTATTTQITITVTNSATTGDRTAYVYCVYEP